MYYHLYTMVYLKKIIGNIMYREKNKLNFNFMHSCTRLFCLDITYVPRLSCTVYTSKRHVSVSLQWIAYVHYNGTIYFKIHH